MRPITTAILVLATACLCSCASVLPETNPDHQVLSTLIRTHFQDDQTKVDGPIRIETRGDKATARYLLYNRVAQQTWNRMKSTLVRQDGAWVLKKSECTDPWYYRYK